MKILLPFFPLRKPATLCHPGLLHVCVEQDEVNYVVSEEKKWVNGETMSTRMMIDGLYWNVLGCNLAVLGCTGLYWAVMDCSGLFCTVLDCTGLSRAGGRGDPGGRGGQGSQDDEPR